MDQVLKNTFVSIIMPCYNAEQFIEQSISSVLNQTYKNWELIIVDDGSTDSTFDLVSEWVVRDNRIRYFFQVNGKQGKARNLGILNAKGPYLSFLDADDLWLPEKLEIQIKEIMEKKVDLVFSNSYLFENNDVDNTDYHMEVDGGVYYDQNSIKLFLEGNRIPILTVLVKKEKVLNVNCFTEKLDIQNVEDYHLWLKLLISGCSFYSSLNILSKYRIHNKSATAVDKVVLNKIPNAFFDLSIRYPSYRKIILKEIKIKFNLIYQGNSFSKEVLADWIKKNTLYISKVKCRYLYLLLNFALPTKVTKRILIHILNA